MQGSDRGSGKGSRCKISAAKSVSARTGPPGDLSPSSALGTKGFVPPDSARPIVWPTSFDVPEIETILVEVANPASPHGIRGVGEVPLVPPMAAIANAIHNAISCRMGELPMSPDKVVAALQDAQLAEAAG